MILRVGHRTASFRPGPFISWRIVFCPKNAMILRYHIGGSSNGKETFWQHSLGSENMCFECNFVRNAGRSSNGRTAAFEAVNLGPIPSLPAVRRKAHILPSLVHLSEGQQPLESSI